MIPEPFHDGFTFQNLGLKVNAFLISWFLGGSPANK
jgi:hypothetical protein